jgi:hypothetical protein
VVDAGDPAYVARLAGARYACFFDLLQWLPDGVARSVKAVAMLLDFDYKGRLKAKRRPERVFVLLPLAPLDLVGTERIPHIPVLATRCSATHQFVPEAAADTLRDTGPVHVPQSVVPPAAAVVTWQVATMAAWASEYPFEDVGALAVQATSTGVQPFVGELCKSVVPRGVRPEGHGLFAYSVGISSWRMWHRVLRRVRWSLARTGGTGNVYGSACGKIRTTRWMSECG